jgi:protein-disulfide isomerase
VENVTPYSSSQEDIPTTDSIPVPLVAVASSVPDLHADVLPVAAAGPSRQSLIIALVAVFFFAAGLIAGGVLFGGGGINQQELAALVRSVVAEEVAKVGGDGSAALINNISDDPSFGADDSVITIIEFSDFYCSFCGRFATQTLPQIQAAYGDKIKFVYRDMPIIGGQASVEAATAANCANEQGKFWEYHNILFANPNARDITARVAFAGELGLDVAAFETCINDPAKVDEIRLDLLDGQALGIGGTPAFYINGRFISGAQPFETFQLLIDTELAKLGVE